MPLHDLTSQTKRLLSSHRLIRLGRALRPTSLVLHARRRLCGDRKIVIVATPHKVGSTWWIQMLSDLVDFEHELGMRRVPSACIDGNTNLLDLAAPEIHSFLESVGGYRLFKSHSHFPWDALPDDVHIVTMHRDPRDAAVSLAFYLTNLHPDSGGYDEEKTHWSIQQKIRDVLEAQHGIDRWDHWFRSSLPSFRTSYEAVKASPKRELTRCINALGMEVAPDRIQEVVDWHSFQRRAGRKPGEANKTSFLRKGISGDWVNYFDQKTVDFFKTVHNGRWNRLLLDMGYETSPHWTLPTLQEAPPTTP